MRREGSLLLLFALMLAPPAPLLAHGALKRAEPAAEARLSVAPRTIRLTFGEPVELALARIELADAGGVAVPLSALRPGDSATVVVADIAGALEAGTFNVTWRVVGRDGHPMRGSYRFIIEPGATGLGAAALGADTADRPPSHPAAAAAPGDSRSAHHDSTASSGGNLDAESPLFAAVRWLGFLTMLALIGSVAFSILVVPGSARRGAPGELLHAVERGGRSVGIAAAIGVIIAALLRLAAQSAAMHGTDGALDAGLVGTMLGSTLWGTAWLLQLGASSLALAGFLLARRARPAGSSLAAVATVAVAVSAALSGHAAAFPRWAGLAVTVDAVHVLGAGGWLGTLLLLVIVGLPAALRLGPGERGPAAAALVNAFSPRALAFAGTAALTGVASAWMHLASPSALWTTAYGRTLLVKLGVLSLVVVTGAYNWLRVRPALGDEEGARRIRRSGTVELLIGVVVLAVTAMLVATPMPGMR